VNRRIKNLRSTLLCCLFLTLVACSPPTSQATNRTALRLVEVTHSPFYAPQYVALANGYFQAEGLDIALSNGNGGDKTMTTLLSGQADIVLVGAEAGIYVTARSSASQAVVAFAQLTQTDGTFLLSRKPIPHFTWDQLKGKTLLGQRRGGMPQMVSQYIQRKHGMEGVHTIQNIEFPHLGSAFAAGTGDFAQLFEPTASKLEKEGKGYIVASFGQESGILPYTCYLTKRAFLQQHPDTLKRFTQAIQKGENWVQTHTAEEIAAVIQPHFPDIDQDTLRQVIRRYQTQDAFAAHPFIDKAEYDHLLHIMEAAGELPKKVPYTELIYNPIQE
jgi:NitT/TauT family transport system substrate-binding protein